MSAKPVSYPWRGTWAEGLAELERGGSYFVESEGGYPVEAGWAGGEIEGLRHSMAHGDAALLPDLGAALDEALAAPASEEESYGLAPCGFAPCVPAYLAGAPASMFAPEASEGLGPIRVVVDTTCSAGVDQRTLHYRAIAVACLVLRLQASRAVSLAVATCSAGYGQPKAKYCAAILEVGSSPLDASRLGVALGHTGIPRRLLYGLMDREGYADGLRHNGSVLRDPAEARAALQLAAEDVHVPGALHLDSRGKVDSVAKAKQWAEERYQEAMKPAS